MAPRKRGGGNSLHSPPRPAMEIEPSPTGPENTPLSLTSEFLVPAPAIVPASSLSMASTSDLSIASTSESKTDARPTVETFADNQLPIVDYTPSKPTEGLFAYDISFIRQEIIGLKRQLHFFEIENGELVLDPCGVKERMEQLEQENIYLKQRIAEHIPQKNVLEETSNKISSLEKQVEETKTLATRLKNDDKGIFKLDSSCICEFYTRSMSFPSKKEGLKTPLISGLEGFPTGISPLKRQKSCF
ncbi:hypothetical protein O6H91_Y044800 [Diphasiastrum complanatum]|nr:hypothetical protein O6H91_Y044800 [Diphasiastrum complanatum]